MRWETTILTISLLITLVFASACTTNLGTTKMNFGNSNEAQKALACFCQTYGDPSTYNGPPRFISPLASTGLKDTIPVDKVTKFSTGTNSIFFWVIYQNFQQGDTLNLSWIFQNNVVTTITKKTDSQTGFAFGEFVRPDAGWPVGTHTIKIEGKGTGTQVMFDIVNGPTQSIIFNFTGTNGVSCQDLITYSPVAPPVAGTTVTPSPVQSSDYWISGTVSNQILSCSPPNNVITFSGSTGPAVTTGTLVQLKIFNTPNSNVQDLPQNGILIGSTNVGNSGIWKYSWNGYVPGYTLKDGQGYMVKTMLSDTMYTKLSFLYQCPTQTSGTCPTGSSTCQMATGAQGSCCAGACVNLQTDPNNCGGCSLSCGQGGSCQNGVCSGSCPQGQTMCAISAGLPPQCVSLSSSITNCGSCGHFCGPTDTCQNGVCILTQCPSGQTPCNHGGRIDCVDLSSDNYNCGFCNQQCVGGTTCQKGVCSAPSYATCASGTTLCNGVCVNLQTDNNNCGSCGTQCGTGQYCNNGVCQTQIVQRRIIMPVVTTTPVPIRIVRE